jgi:hypothetical protein
MAESLTPDSLVASGTEPLGAWRVPVWVTALLTLAAAVIAAWATQAWLLREPPQAPSVHGMLTDGQAPIDLAPTAAGTPTRPATEQAPAMLYGMLPLHSGHGLRDEQCRQMAADAMREAGITEIDTGGESALFARLGDYALFVGCHLDQKLILVGAAGPVPEQAESLQEQLLRSLQTRF